MSKKYDVIIIGAGIGGLVCGCYLAKAGKKVLIVEKNKQLGGYCRSFHLADGLKFDACVHSLASCRENGTLGIILDELDLRWRLSFLKFEIPNIVLCGDLRVNFYRENKRTLEELSILFPEESNSLEKFFKYILDSNKLEFVSLRNQSFKFFLDGYFRNTFLKKIISEIILISTGVFPEFLSAFVGCSTLKEYIFDGGYYPCGGVQDLPDALSMEILDKGGHIVSGVLVKEILVKNGKVKGVMLDNDSQFFSDYVVSNVDVSQTFTKLLKNSAIATYWNAKLAKMIPSLSSFCCYISAKKMFNLNQHFESTIYILNENQDIQSTYNSINTFNNRSLILTSPSYVRGKDLVSSSVPFLILTNTLFKNREFWAQNKRIFLKNLLEQVRKYFPDVIKSVYFYGAATPITLFNWTLNYQGASYGWAAVPEQIGDPELSQVSGIDCLYLVGHWTTLSHGVMSVAYSGRKIAKAIIRKESQRHSFEGL